MNILLTGSNGFVGSHVARKLLEKGHNIRSLYLHKEHLSPLANIQDKLQLIKSDLFHSTESELLEICKDIDTCIHCAWYAVPGKYLHSHKNLDCLNGSLRLFDALGKAGCKRFIGIGTCFEYDTDYGYLSETTPAKPDSLYAAAKASASLTGEQIANTYDMSFAWARLFYLYGPNEHSQRLIPYVINSLMKDHPAEIGSGIQIRDYLHVIDAAAAIVAVTESDLIGPVNIGSAEPVKIKELVNLISKIMNKPQLVKIGARQTAPKDPPFICANNTKLKTQTGWLPKYDIEEGLTQTIQWWKERLHSL